MDTEVSLSLSQKPAIGPYLKQEAYSPHLPTSFP